MSDVTDYCDKTYKRLIGLKAGLYDVIKRTEKEPDEARAAETKNLMAMIDEIEAGLEELKNQCPADWSPDKRKLDESMTRLSEALGEVAGRLGVTVPDTTAWI